MKTMTRLVAHSAVVVAVVGVCLAGCGFSVRDLAEQINGRSGQSQPESPAAPAQPRHDSSTQRVQANNTPQDESPVSREDFDPTYLYLVANGRGYCYGWNKGGDRLLFVLFLREPRAEPIGGAMEKRHIRSDWRGHESFELRWTDPNAIELCGKTWSLLEGRLFLVDCRGKQADVKQIRKTFTYDDTPEPVFRIANTVKRLEEQSPAKEFLSD